MIDLHSHILPGIDDGALDVDDSTVLARQAEADGIEAICATPHIRHDHDVRIEELAGRVESLNRHLRDQGIALTVLTGGEVAETAVDDLSEEELARVALGAGGWILLEPAPGPLGESLERRVAGLAERGHRALIAHPERHVSEDMYARIEGLVAAGALVQATADFFLREETAAAMASLAEAGLVHLLASDTHSSLGGRPAKLSAAFERLAEVEPAASHIEWIRDEAPRAIVSGDPVERPF